MIGSVVANQGGRIDRINKVYRAYDYVYHAADWTPQNAVDDALGGTPAQGASSVRSASNALYFGPGAHTISEPVQIYSAINPTVICDPCAVLNVTADMDTVFDVCGTNNFTWIGGTINIANGVTVGAVLKCYTDTNTAQLLSLDPYITRLKIQKTGTGYFSAGIQMGIANTSQAGEGYIEHCQIDGLFGSTGHGIHLLGAWGNNLNYTVIGCRVYNADVAYRVQALNGATFINCTADGGAPASGGGACAYMIDAIECTIVGPARVEAHQRLLKSNGPSNNAMSCSLVGPISFSGQEMSAADFIAWDRAGYLDLGRLHVYSPAVTPEIKIAPASSSQCELSGSITIFSDANRPTAANLVNGANARGQISYTQASAATAWVSREIVSLDP